MFRNLGKVRLNPIYSPRRYVIPSRSPKSGYSWRKGWRNCGASRFLEIREHGSTMSRRPIVFPPRISQPLINDGDVHHPLPGAGVSEIRRADTGRTFQSIRQVPCHTRRPRLIEHNAPDFRYPRVAVQPRLHKRPEPLLVADPAISGYQTLTVRPALT